MLLRIVLEPASQWRYDWRSQARASANAWIGLLLYNMKRTPLWDEDFQVMLRSAFHYDPDTGIVSRRYAAKKSPAGPLTSVSAQGAIQTNFFWGGRSYNLTAHRLAFFLHTGKQPAEVWHKDLDKTNNKFDNLIPVYSKDEIRETFVPVDYAALSREPGPTLPVNVPKPELAKIPTSTVLNLDETHIESIKRGSMIATSIGGAFSTKYGEILPRDYTYKDKGPEEQARLRRGWAALLYYGEDSFGMSEATRDQQAGKQLRYLMSEMIRPATVDLTPEEVAQLVATNPVTT